MLIENIGKLMVGILLVYLGLQVGGAMVGIVMATILGWYITDLYLRSHTKRKAQAEINLRQMLSFAIPVLVQSFSITSIYSSDVILVKHFFSTYNAGIYAALSTLGKIIFFGAGPIGAVMFPLISQKEAKGQPYRKIFAYSFLITILLAAVVLLFYWLDPYFVIRMLFGTKYLGAATLLVWFGLFISLFTLSSLLISYGLSLGRTSIVILPLIAALAQIILIWFFHQTLFTVVLISVAVSALLLASLLIYSTVHIYGERSL